MIDNTRYILLFLILVFLLGCKKNSNKPETPPLLQLIEIKTDEASLRLDGVNKDVPVNSIFYLRFSTSLDSTTIRKAVQLKNNENNFVITYSFEFLNNATTVALKPNAILAWNTSYTLEISNELKSITSEVFPGLIMHFETEQGKLLLTSAEINGLPLNTSQKIKNIPYDSLFIELHFNEAVDTNNIAASIKTIPPHPLHFSFYEDNKKIVITNSTELSYYQQYIFVITASLNSAEGFDFEGFDKHFTTGLDPRLKFPNLSEETLLNLVQEKTFRYFWDHAHPVSGLARERLNSGETVTTGGSGFGLMVLLVGIERGFISRSEGIERLSTITNFLADADRFHGVWPHWMNGSTGRTIAFSSQDDGGDLVETSFLAAGLLTVRQYLRPENNTELALVNLINNLLNTIEWNWYTRDNQNVLYWHWSPNNGWAMNMQVRGYNEALITYIMAASSTTYPIEAEVYHQGWAQSGGIINGNDYFDINLPLGFAYGGPLFFAHYSFLGLNPNGLSDSYADYLTQNQNHTLINRQHCIKNPHNKTGYSNACWGLTASDEPGGYGVHEPTRDNGTISPTAALSSMPYTPEQSIEALNHFYYILGDNLWGEYGFYDAFNPEEGWWSDAYLAIDQGPIIIMIENHRSGLIWDLFMSAPEIQTALDKLNFSQQKK
ncbi:MAG: glucoamylase family protein [Bacteroidales bacterium]|nr:glucoamylase family protein [Bacteroidales bacterium]HOI32280.1 glucoamylase family protein [Bacteroidales bacterium]